LSTANSEPKREVRVLGSNGTKFARGFEADLIVDEVMIVELKSVEQLA
jgi:hypothetical protein